jgi:acetolactate synthase regulatory subunit
MDSLGHAGSNPIAPQRRAIPPELNLLLANREGAVVRILGLVERRGFRFGAISMHPTPQGTRLSLTLASDDRPAEVLLRQVARLQDVLEAALEVERRPHAS